MFSLIIWLGFQPEGKGELDPGINPGVTSAVILPRCKKAPFAVRPQPF